MLMRVQLNIQIDHLTKTLTINVYTYNNSHNKLTLKNVNYLMYLKMLIILQPLTRV